jgi:hypothetical protein
MAFDATTCLGSAVVPWRRVRAGWLALTGASGVVVAHVVGYTAVYPHGHQRAVYLDATGHGYWPIAVALAVAGAAASLAAAVHNGWLLARGPHRMSEAVPFWLRLAGLTTWQMLLFGAMESMERLHAGISPTVLLSSPEFGIGLAVQVAVALLALMLTRWFERLGSLVANALADRARHVPRAVLRPVGQHRLPGLPGWSSSRSRAPPPTVIAQL